MPPQTRREAKADAEARGAVVQKRATVLFSRGLLYVVVWSMQLVVSSLISPILVHLMPPSEFGVLASAMAIFQALVVLAVAGLDQAAVLQRAEDGNDRKARGLLAVGVTTAVVIAVTAATTVPLWGDVAGFVSARPVLLVVVLWTGPAAIVQLCLSFLVAQDRLRVFAVTSLLSSVGGSVIGLALLTLLHGDATTYAWGTVIAQTVAMVIGLLAARPRLAGLLDRRTNARAFRLGVPVAFGALAYFVLNAGDRIVVQRLLGPEEVARYQIAYVVGSAVILLLTFTNQAWSPHFAGLRDADARRELAMHARDQLYLLLAPVLVAVTLVSPIVLPILAPASYRVHGLTVVVFVVALTAFPVVASGATDPLLIVERRGIALGSIAAIAAVVNIGANLVLVPRLGIAGAGIATVIAFIVVAGLQLAVLRDRREWRGPRFRIVLVVAASILVSAVSVLVPQDLVWNCVRVVGIIACLPFFVHRLRVARGGLA